MNVRGDFLGPTHNNKNSDIKILIKVQAGKDQEKAMIGKGSNSTKIYFKQ